jgi:hypothetical protein
MYPYFKRFDMQITDANKTYSADFDLDKDVRVITGLLLTSDQDDQLYYRGAQAISINGKEYFPDNYESKLLMSGINVRPNQRYYEIGKYQVLNGKIKITYTDTDNPNNVSFSAYRVSLYVRGEKENPS